MPTAQTRNVRTNGGRKQIGEGAMTKPPALAPAMLAVSIAGLCVILPVSAQPKKAFMICAATPAITRPTPHFSKARSVLTGASAISRSLRVINSSCA